MEGNGKRKWWVLGSLTFGILAISLDMTILNVALPTLAEELQASTGALQWIIDSYTLVLAAILLPAGMLGDRYGRKKFLLAALIVFGLASAGCALADSSAQLIAMRCLLGLGAAFIMPLSMSILPVLFEGEERTKAMMIWTMANMFGIPIGPILGGWLLKHYDWGSVFLINLPLVAVALLAVGMLLPESRSSSARRPDFPGILTSSLGLGGFTYGIIRAGETSWSDPLALLAIAAGMALLLVFVLWQRRASQPLIELDLFRSSRFTWGAILSTMANFAMFGIIFALPQFFQAVQGADPLTTGLRLLPLIAGVILGAKAAQSLLARAGTRTMIACGFAALTAGLAAGALTTADSGFGFAAVWSTVVGIGLGMALPTSMDAALGELTAERSGVGSALITALRQFGGSLGVALLGAALNATYRSRLALGDLPEAAVEKAQKSVAAGMAAARAVGSEPLLQSVKHSFTGGMGVMLGLCGGITLLGIAMALAFLPKQSVRLGTARERSV